MNLFLIVFSVCILATNAIPSGRISNGVKAQNASHVCMVLVVRPELENTETAVLGSGSIISTRHVLTAAHVVEGVNNRFIINFMDGAAGRSFQTSFALIPTCTVAGHGFTSVQTKGVASIDVHAAVQRTTNNCHLGQFETAASHFCAVDEVSNPRNIVCPGDNGAGLYITNATTGVNSLIGVASHVGKGCSTASYTAYTQVSLFSVWLNAIKGA